MDEGYANVEQVSAGPPAKVLLLFALLGIQDDTVMRLTGFGFFGCVILGGFVLRKRWQS